MRLWSLHPSLLDAKGLVAAWREALLAKAVLSGQTRGYRNHPQLERFRKTDNPVSAINAFLGELHKESERRGYHFQKAKIDPAFIEGTAFIPVTTKQVAYEFGFLKEKLLRRDTNNYLKLCQINKIPINGIFFLVQGEVESWEKIRPKDKNESFMFFSETEACPLSDKYSL